MNTVKYYSFVPHDNLGIVVLLEKEKKYKLFFFYLLSVLIV